MGESKILYLFTIFVCATIKYSRKEFNIKDQPFKFSNINHDKRSQKIKSNSRSWVCRDVGLGSLDPGVDEGPVVLVLVHLTDHLARRTLRHLATQTVLL